MSVIHNLDNTFHFQPLESTRKAFLSYWEGRTLHYGHLGINTTTIAKVAYRALGILALSIAGIFLTLSLCGMGLVGHPLIIPVSLLASFFSFRQSWSIKHEQETRIVDGLRNGIEDLSLIEISRRFSWNDIFRLGILTPEEFAALYRQQMKSMTIDEVCHFYEKMVKNLDNCQNTKYIYYIPSPSQFREKWIAETQNKTFEQIREQYSFEQLEKHHILCAEESAFLVELNSNLEKANNQRIVDLQQRRPDIFASKLALQNEALQIEENFKKNPLVERLENMESEYNARCAAVHNRGMQLKELAYTECRQFLEQRKLPYSKLKSEDRAKFDMLKQQYRQADDQIAIAAESNLLKLQQNYKEAKRVLIDQVAELRRQCDVRIKKLTTKAEQSTLEDPSLDKRFNNIVEDLNRQYNARRKILRNHF